MQRCWVSQLTPSDQWLEKFLLFIRARVPDGTFALQFKRHWSQSYSGQLKIQWLFSRLWWQKEMEIGLLYRRWSWISVGVSRLMLYVLLLQINEARRFCLNSCGTVYCYQRATTCIKADKEIIHICLLDELTDSNEWTDSISNTTYLAKENIKFKSFTQFDALFSRSSTTATNLKIIRGQAATKRQIMQLKSLWWNNE